MITPAKTLKVDALTVQIYDSPDAVALAGSAITQNILQNAITRNGSTAAIFATGRSQIQFLQHLTAPSNLLNWQNITGFHLDEYLGISAHHPASFRHYLHQHLTSKVSLAQWYAIEGDGLLPLDTCREYEQALRAHPTELCCLGIGNNGHLAFNDPDVAHFNDPDWVKIVRLDQQNRQQQAKSSAFKDLAAVPQYAFTLTLSAIQASHHSLCLAYGKGKANIVHQLLTGPIQPQCPASILRQMPQAQLLIDKDAASLIL